MVTIRNSLNLNNIITVHILQSDGLIINALNPILQYINLLIKLLQHMQNWCNIVTK